MTLKGSEKMDNYFEDPLIIYKKNFDSISSKKLKLISYGFNSQINIRCRNRNLSIFENELGLSFPKIVNSYSSYKNYQILCLSPDEWIVLAPLEEKEDLLSQIIKLNKVNDFSITDVSFNRVTIGLSGDKSNDFLSSFVNTNKEDLVEGKFFQSTIAKVQVIIICLNQNNNYKIIVRSSFSRFLAEVFLDYVKYI